MPNIDHQNKLLQKYLACQEAEVYRFLTIIKKEHEIVTRYPAGIIDAYMVDCLTGAKRCALFKIQGIKC